jgi:hypothetical protein
MNARTKSLARQRKNPAERMMTMRTYVFMIMMVFCCSTSSFADTLKDEDEVKRFGDSVLETAVVDGVVEAFDAMAPFVQLNEAEMNSLAKESKKQRDQYVGRFGKSVGYEFLGKSTVGTSLIMLQYIEKTERHAFPWTFYFYKTEQGWMLNDFAWHGDIRRLFSETASLWPE